MSMSATHDDFNGLQGRRDWGKALAAFRRLIADKEDTAQVFEIMRALAGRSMEKGYLRLLKTPGGAPLAWRQVDMAARLSDDAWLDAFAEGTVGAAYRHFVRSENLSAEGLAMESRRGEAMIDADHPFAWYARRLRDVHDVWHVLTGYHRDALGEACVVAFSYAQTGSLGFGFIGWGAAREIGKEAPSIPARRAVLQAWRNGRRAAWLPAVEYEALFAETLEDARSRLGIRSPSVYLAVPDGVRNGVALGGAR